MQVQLIETARGFEIQTDEEKFGTLIQRKSGESDDVYKERAIREFDDYVRQHRELKNHYFKKNVIKSDHL